MVQALCDQCIVNDSRRFFPVLLVYIFIPSCIYDFLTYYIGSLVCSVSDGKSDL